ncbi:uncharacterized protein [Hetaerina americana]|uniref:uncharacterized protein n=1 Tax=Hetaerina americana TaxID=62018 RepID=UPI003A7F44AE
MCDKTAFELCRLCLNSGGLLLINVFDENTNLEFMLKKTIEDLIDVKVVEEAGFPWMVCSNCMEKLTIFRLFKRRCAECLFVFYNRIKKGYNLKTEDWITNGEEVCKVESDVGSHDNADVEFSAEDSIDGTSDKMWALSNSMEVGHHLVLTAPVAAEETEGTWVVRIDANVSNAVGIECRRGEELKEEFGVATIASEAVDRRRDVDVRDDDDMAVVKEKIDAASGILPLAPGKDVDSTMVASMQDNCSHWSGSEEAGNMCRRGEELKEEFGVATIASEAVDRRRDVDVRDDDDMAVVKEEIDAASGILPVAPGKDVDSTMVASMQDNCSHWSGGEEAGNLGPSVDGQLPLSFNEEVDIKEDCDDDIPQEEGCLGADQSEEQDGCQGQENAGKDETGNLPHTCLICSDIFPQKDALEAHMRRVHQAKKIQFKCVNCNESFGCPSELEGHVKTAHAKTRRQTVKRKHKCPECPRRFRYPCDVRIHMVVHTGEKPFKCEICSRNFGTKQTLEHHMYSHTDEKPFKCEICAKGFIRKEHLQKHTLTHTGERPFKCNECSKTFCRKYDLSKHISTHTPRLKNQCKLCSNGFAKRKHLMGKNLSHPVNRPFICDLCCRCFSRKDHLVSHMIIHTVGKPFKCKVCWKSYRHKRSLDIHNLVHSKGKRLKCELCPKQFLRQSTLSKHMKLHSVQNCNEKVVND